MFGISYDPAYLVTVSALPCLIAPVTNLRNTVLIQAAIKDTLGIPGNRGVIKFESVAEENFATNGTTIKDEIEQLERTSNEEYGVIKNISRSMSRKIKSNSSRANTRSTMYTQSVPLSTIQTASWPETPPTTPVDGTSQKVRIKGKYRILQTCKNISQRFWR